MKAKVNGIEIEGTPQEIAEYVRSIQLVTVYKPKVTEDCVYRPYSG
ncbi:hypothetical protein PACILC2_22660 [Paenibacillus cisolokensis]|uniref:Uncharacterized protein n=1 Tax=Paenibacillus cisolokensis TaxID=1658519 RepID=A0ABQ4N649_9BACL|nr:hypothetical protein PACILC2_22660 [Paenibacillus cisolokensis]